MQIQSLNRNWQVRQQEFEEWFSASVPGSVHTALMAARRIPDPFIGTNEAQVQWVAEKNWVYRLFFYPSPGILDHERVELVFDGLDTLAEVRLNGAILGTADNMHRSWHWEVKDLLQAGENRLEVLFRSPLAYTRARQRVKPLAEMSMGASGGEHMRKTPSHFGWDWGPVLPCVGIWRGVRLEGRSKGRITNVAFEQRHEPDQVTLTAVIETDFWAVSNATSDAASGAARQLRMRVSGPDGRIWQADAPARSRQTLPLVIANPQLWWPNGLGEQPLYQVEIELLEEEQVIDQRSYTVGLRTLELRQEADDYGTSFTFYVNGVRLFAKGANWIPADSFPERVTPERYEALIRSAAQSNHNMLRIWGGGYYEDDCFYDLCDRYGILVWQDFLFACYVYPLDDPDYVESARAEAVENVRRLRHHASLALWCGNNEIEMLMALVGWKKKWPELAEAYERFFFHILPEVIAAEDPDRPYWPSSPSSNDPFNQPNSERTGDAHLWEVYHMFKPPAYYRSQNPRFVSEFGFQSLPSLETIRSFAGEKDLRLNSAVMQSHQKAAAGNPKLLWYLAQRFRLPRRFQDLVYLSQVFQAEAVRTGVEHWRRQPERTGGALYWQLNDCWPVISWASIDYTGRWKALQYASKRFFAPVLLSLDERSEKGQRKVDVWLSNDSCDPYQGRLKWTLETLDGEVLEGGEQPIHTAPLTAERLIRLDFAAKTGKRPRIQWSRTVFVAELWQGDSLQATQAVTFLPEKRMALGDPGLQAEVIGTSEDGTRLQIKVSTRRLARFVEIAITGADVIFSDNYFDLPAGRQVVVECDLPQGLTLEQIRERLQVRSLSKSLPAYPAVVTGIIGAAALVSCLGQLLWQLVLKPKLKKPQS